MGSMGMFLIRWELWYIPSYWEMQDYDHQPYETLKPGRPGLGKIAP